jgi:2-Cys peroxiredoxin 5
MLVLSALVAASAISTGTKVPSLELDYGFPPAKVNLAERLAGKKVVLVGLPGAFTPT